jgi:predicted nuclease with TOPRIM domain
MSEPLQERLAQLEAGVRHATEVIGRLRKENERLLEERKQVLSQVDSILKDLGDLEAAP